MENQKNQNEINNIKCKYTLVPIENKEHMEKLENFINARGKVKLKSSLCRFYLRGICIMKPQYCKFAHSINELNINSDEGLFYMTLSDKQRKKREFTQKKEFNQTALFILKNVHYHNLYDFQFSQRFKKTKLKVHDVDSISKERAIRIRIRQIMHRQIWDGFIDFLQKKFPNTNFPISFISFWYANFGFDKPQTRCKFGDFLKYAMVVRNYKQVDIIFPPNAFSSIYLINTKSKVTILEQNIDQIYQRCMKLKEQQGKQKKEEFLSRALPEQLSKKYICRYFMAGNCQDSSQNCLYAHSIQQLRQCYQIGQEFPVQFRQPVMPIEVRMNFTSLYHATRKYQKYSQYSLQDINLNSTIRYQLRQRVHFQLFGEFMKLIEQLFQPNKNQKEQKFFSIQLKQLHKCYYAAGFNHTNQNKFQHFQGSLWDLGYYMEDIVVKDEKTLQKRKCTYVYKIPPLQYLNKRYKTIIQDCVKKQIQTLSQNGVLLESALRRTIYSHIRDEEIIPLHVYLRYRLITFQELIEQLCQRQEINRIFFQSGQQNAKKIKQFVKKYLKKNKKFIFKLDEIQNFIKNQKKNQVNLNHHFISLKTIIQNTVVEVGKILYYWPFDNNFFVIDQNHAASYKKNVVQPIMKSLDCDQNLQQFLKKCTEQQINNYLNQRIIIVDSLKTLQYSKKYLQGCGKMGVDLQGRLRKNGYIDLIQISGVKRDQNNKIKHKQIFVFDIWVISGRICRQQWKLDTEMNEQTKQMIEKNKQYKQSQQLIQTVKLIKRLLQSKQKVKILHDCRQDSVALKYILGIQLQNVFDTSGFDVYLNQNIIYEQDKNLNSMNLIRKIHEVKVPGLNTILDTYKAPNGVNIFKESMKKRFGDQDSRSYFEERPINMEFLQYSAQDVEDLIQVYETMIEKDDQNLSYFIGELYSSC